MRHSQMRSGIFSSPFLLGFDHIERLLEHTSRASQDSYPPNNIEHIGENRLLLTVAVAGFAADELQLTQEDNQLVLRGKQSETGEKTFLHRGIAGRPFQRSFVLAEGITVREAELYNGLLRIELVRPEPKKTVRAITIRSGNVQPELDSVGVKG